MVVTTVAAVQIAIVTQAAICTRSTLPDRSDADLYIAALAAGSFATVALGILVTALIARAPRAVALIALTIGAIAAQSWAARLIVPVTSLVTETPQLLPLVPWIAPVLTGAAIVWTGLNSLGRIAAAAAALTIVWIAPATMTGISSALGTRVLWRDVSEMTAFAIGVFRSALLTPALALPPILATIVVAAVGLGVRLLAARRRGEERVASG